mmetsp:Transcript_100172/g.150180  ORF Transcript_100172/g.150180 Transcript_100172/m.150180 type:complete len:413 (+) Transcript_100172:151-1389(+)
MNKTKKKKSWPTGNVGKNLPVGQRLLTSAPAPEKWKRGQRGNSDPGAGSNPLVANMPGERHGDILPPTWATEGSLFGCCSSSTQNAGDSIVGGARSHRITTPNPEDILLGRGKPYQEHPGNEFMRHLSDLNKDLYANLPRDKRGAVANRLMDHLRKMGVRFLKRDDRHTEGGCTKAVVWEEATSGEAYEKMCHSLRAKPRHVTTISARMRARTVAPVVPSNDDDTSGGHKRTGAEGRYYVQSHMQREKAPLSSCPVPPGNDCHVLERHYGDLHLGRHRAGGGRNYCGSPLACSAKCVPATSQSMLKDGETSDDVVLRQDQKATSCPRLPDPLPKQKEATPAECRREGKDSKADAASSLEPSSRASGRRSSMVLPASRSHDNTLLSSQTPREPSTQDLAIEMALCLYLQGNKK